MVLGAGGGLLPWAIDDRAGVVEIRYRWDGGVWSRWKSGPLTPPGPGAELAAYADCFAMMALAGLAGTALVLLFRRAARLPAAGSAPAAD